MEAHDDTDIDRLSEGSSSEEEVVEVTDSEEETEQGQEEEVVGRQTDSQNNYQQEEQRNIPKTVSFNVVTRNIKKVEWPPKDSTTGQGPMRVPFARRFKSDWKFPDSSKPLSSYPFSRGYTPSKLDENVWSHGDPEKETDSNETPKVVLRDANSILTQEIPSAQSHYKMPPCTARTRKWQENYESLVAKEKA